MLNKAQKNVPFPGWDALDAEKQEMPAQVILTIQDENGNMIKKLSKKPLKGVIE